MSMSRIELDQMQARLERNRRAGLRAMEPLPCEVVARHTAAIGQEIEHLHEPFMQWCNLHEILVPGYSRPDKSTRNSKGQWDFPLMKNSCCALVEFKAVPGAPESGLSEDQIAYGLRADRAGVPKLVTNSLEEAIEFARKVFNI